MKQRFSSLDVKVIAHELSTALVSLRIANIYDLSSRIFLIKCAKPGSREQLLVDSGFRCHLTSFTRNAASAPSAFVTRLRKYLKSRRITSVTQIGTDRVIEITFSDGTYRLFLEFFAAGNIVLADRELNVLALLRQVSEGDEDVDVKLGGKYSVEAKQNFNGVPPLTKERVREVLERHVERMRAMTEAGGKANKKTKSGEDLRKALSSGFSEYPAQLLDHAFKVKGFDPMAKPEKVLQSEDTLSQLLLALQFADETFRSLGSSDDAHGYIIAKLKQPEKAGEQATPTLHDETAQDSLLYDDFHPFRPVQFESKAGVRILDVVGFNKTVDEFYSSLESQKLESRLTEKEEAARRKLETAKKEHAKRVGALQHVQELHVRKAQAIEANTHRVEEAIAAVNGLIGQGMDWMDIAKLIENEQARGNAVAQTVKLPLKLYENTVTLLLDEPGAEEDEDDVVDESYNSEDEDVSEDEQTKPEVASREKLAIDVDLVLSPWANARQYYDQKKTAAVKEQKTLQASTKALKSTEKKIEADLKKGLKQETQSLRPARRKMFFESLLYFVSSDGYLVLGGKDAKQNEFLYRRQLKKGDVYVHADLQGAASVVVKNNPKTPDAPIPPTTLSQAGALAVCTSSAWDSKAIMAAWWVNAEQVSKTVESTQQIITKDGDFVIKGSKNFLPPSQLLLGFGVMWLIDEESRANHSRLRVQDSAMATNTGTEVTNLAGDVGGLSVQGSDADEAPPGGVGVVHDVEDAADEAEKESDGGKSPADDIDHDENASTVGSEAEADEERLNPLQVIEREPQKVRKTKSETPAEHDGHENESDINEDLSQDEEQTGAELNSAPGTTTLTSPEDAASENDAHASASEASRNQPLKAKTAQAPRGKRSKAARAAKKYANQDEEDRALAMSLLGSTKQQQAKVDAEAERKEREEKLARDKERRRAQHERAKKEEARRGKAAESGDGFDPTEQDQDVLAQEAADLANLDLLVPSLMPSDVLIAAVPVVAPWTALGRYKYKVKLQPGNVKKGKAVREIIGVWSGLASKGGKVIDSDSKDRERVWPGEVAKIKDWRFEEVVGVLPVKGVRVVQSSAATANAGTAKGKGSGSGARGGRGSKKTR